MSQSSYVESELSRIRALLSPKRVGTTLQEIEADPSAERIGAEAGIGFKATNPDLTFNVYVFKDWDGSTNAADEFDALHADDPEIYAPVATNGPLVFYGFVNTSTPDGIDRKYALADFVSAFAGNE